MLGAIILTAAAAPAAQACTITWVGGVASAPTAWFGFDPHGAGTGDDQYNWNQQRFPGPTDDVCFPNGAVATTNQVDQNTPDVRSFTIAAGATLSITDVQVIVRESSTNAGTLNMSGAVPLTISDGDAADHEGLTNTGKVHFTSGGPAGIRAIIGDLTNLGTVDVDHPQASIQNSAPGQPSASIQTNQGTVDISPGNNLRSIISNFINGTGGVITGGGSMSMDQARFEAAGNSQIVAPTDINVTNTTIAGPVGSTASGNIDVIGAFAGGGPSTLEGTVPAGITLDVDQTTLRSPAVTTTVNAGRINLNGNGAQLQVLPNDSGLNSTSKLTNNGIIEFGSGLPSGFRRITGNLVNQGTILVNDAQASFEAPGGTSTPPSLTNTGTITVSSGSVLRMILSPVLTNGANGVINGAGTINQDTGSMAVAATSQIGAGVDFNLSGGAALSLAGPATGNIDVVNSTTALTGNVPGGFSLDISGGATVRSLSSFTNAGTINLIDSSALATEDGTAGTTETLTNTGTLTSGGSGGVAALSGDLVNQAQIMVGHPTTRFDQQHESRAPKLTNAAGATLTVAAAGSLGSIPGEAQAMENAGTVQLNGTLAPLGYTQTAGQTTLAVAAPTHSIGIPVGSGVVSIQGGVLRGTGIINADLANSGGTVAPGTSPGTIQVLRNYTQGAGGRLAVEVSGPDAGTGYDQLVVDGTASLGGALDVTTSSFTPATGQQFKILDAAAPPAAPTVSGSFATVQQNGGTTYDVAVNPTDVTLTAQAPVSPPPPADTDGDAVPDGSDNCPAQAGPASNGGCPIVASPPDNTACNKARAQLKKAKATLRRLKARGAAEKAIKRARAKVRKHKRAVKRLCG